MPPTILRALVCTLLLAELLLFTWLRGAFGPFASAVVLYLLPLLACGLLYHYYRHRPWLAPPSPEAATPSAPRAPRALALAGAAATGVWLSSERVLGIIERYIIDINFSDIIPALQVYCRRWLVDAEIYAPLTWELGYFALPTYLPATWFPFVAAEYWHFDYRLIAWIIALLFGAGGYLLVLWRLGLAWLPTLLLGLVPFAILFAFARTEEAIFAVTVEVMILGYYGLLVAGILLRCWPLQALALILCLLSRYSLVFWVPLYLGLVFFQQSRRHALLLAGVVGAGVLGLYVMPYLSHNWGLFMAVQRSYTDVALGEWKHLNAAGLPTHLYNGIGVAPFFYEHGTGTLRDKIVLLKTFHFALLVFIVLGAGLLYWRQRQPRPDYRVFAVLVLKVYLTTFYTFLQVPYAYLATTGIFLSAFLLLLVAATPNLPKSSRLLP